MASPQPLSPTQLLELAETDVRHPIPPADVFKILSQPPFLIVPGTFNARDVGLVPGSPIRAGYVFRSGSLESLNDAGRQTISHKLGIKTIFDLRSDHERERHPEPDVPGVVNVWVPNSYSNTINMDDFVSGGGEEGYRQLYMDIMEVYAPTMKAVLEHVRDEQEKPFLFHCALGRDRTGILSGLLMSLSGADEKTIALDYMLTRIGSEPVRETLLARAKQDNACEGGLDVPSFRNLCSLRVASWELFMKHVESEYGGFEGYVTVQLGFATAELEQIRRNLRS